MSTEEKEKGFDYEAHERLKKELEDGASAADLSPEAAEASMESDANEDGEELIHDSSGLPPFWKPETAGEALRGVVCSVRKTKFEKPAVHLRTALGMMAVPVSAGLEDVNFEALTGRRLTITFKGLAETKSGRFVKQFRVTAEKLPF
jgi:hypothetical protein